MTSTPLQLPPVLPAGTPPTPSLPTEFMDDDSIAVPPIHGNSLFEWLKDTVLERIDFVWSQSIVFFVINYDHADVVRLISKVKFDDLWQLRSRHMTTLTMSGSMQNDSFSLFYEVTLSLPTRMHWKENQQASRKSAIRISFCHPTLLTIMHLITFDLECLSADKCYFMSIIIHDLLPDSRHKVPLCSFILSLRVRACHN